MGLLFAYIIKSTFCLTLFYLFYRILLSKETFYRFNRILLGNLILFSAILPFIQIPTEKVAPIQYSMINIEQFMEVMELSVQEANSVYGLQILITLYIVGLLFCFGRLIYSILSIIKVIQGGEKIKLEKNITLVIIKQDIVSFSWMYYVVISKEDWENDREGIVEHEMAHIHHRHSWDLLMCELYVVFHWFNPVAWLLKQELQTIHEYEADESVLNQGIDAKRYQLLLIKKAVGTQRFNSMTNGFNHSKLKKRITMMLKSKSNAWARLKFIYVFPLAALSVVAFAHPKISGELSKISNVKFNEFSLIGEASPSMNNQEQEGVQKDSQDDVELLLKKHLEEIHTSFRELKEAEMAKIQDSINKSLAEIDVFGEKERFNAEIQSAIREGERNLDKRMAEKEKDMQSSFISSLIATGQTFISVNGKKATQQEFNELKPEQIKNLRYDMNLEKAKKYGEDVKAVIFVETRK